MDIKMGLGTALWTARRCRRQGYPVIHEIDVLMSVILDLSPQRLFWLCYHAGRFCSTQSVR